MCYEILHTNMQTSPAIWSHCVLPTLSIWWDRFQGVKDIFFILQATGKSACFSFKDSVWQWVPESCNSFELRIPWQHPLPLQSQLIISSLLRDYMWHQSWRLTVGFSSHLCMAMQQHRAEKWRQSFCEKVWDDCLLSLFLQEEKCLSPQTTVIGYCSLDYIIIWNSGEWLTDCQKGKFEVS